MAAKYQLTNKPGTSQPRIYCDQCGQPIWEWDQYQWAVAHVEQEEGEPEDVGRLVHEACWEEWAKAHDVELD